MTLKRQAKAMIDTMSPAQLRAASEFLAFVKRRSAVRLTFNRASRLIKRHAAAFDGCLPGKSWVKLR
jgi:hypothetical protein